MSLIVHIGAGKHPDTHDVHFKRLLRSALHSTTLTEASHVIERCVSTNTAKGSSLDLQGNASSDCTIIEVESQAIKSQCSVMNIQNQRYPTAFTHTLSAWLDTQYGANSIYRVLGLSRPISLEYNAIKAYIQSQNDPLSSELVSLFLADNSLVSKKALNDYEAFHAYMKEIPGRAGISRDNDSQMNCNENVDGIDIGQVVSTEVQDTVGLMYLDHTPGGRISLAASSGGNFYRVPGRISCAGVPGSGLAYGSYGDIETCCMCSGNGDDIIQMNLASYLCDTIAEQLAGSENWPELGDCLVDRVTRRGARLGKLPYLGVVLTVRSKIGFHLVYCHSTETFYFGFQSNGDTEVVLSRNGRSPERFLHGEYKLW